jgi:hypothetical protein
MNHYNLHFVKVTEELPNGAKILGYSCINLPTLGTIRSYVSTWDPTRKQLEATTSSIHFAMAQWVADYIRSIELLNKFGSDLVARDLFLEQAEAAPYDPDAKEFPEVINHHGLLYWKSVVKTDNQDIILSYENRDFKNLGALKIRVATLEPDWSYKTAVLAATMNQINQYLTDYVMFLEDLRLKSKHAPLPLFDLSDSGTANLREV